MTGNAAPPRRRRRRIGWFLPLLATPVIFVVGMVITGVIEQAGAPEILWRVPWVLTIGGALLSFVVFGVEAVRALSPHAGRLTPEEEAEYREYLRLYGGGKAPVFSITGLLAFAIFLTIVSLGAAALIVLNLPHTLGLAPEPAVELGSGSSGLWLIVAVIAAPVVWKQYAAARLMQTQYRERLAAEYPAPSGRPLAAGRRHRTWVLPLLAIPAIILVAVLIILGLRSVDAPRDAIRAVSFTMLFGIAVALIALVIAIARFLRTPPGPRVPRAPGFYEHLSTAHAAGRGLTPEEYGVYKGDVGSGVGSVTSAGGLLFLAILISVINAFLLVLVGVMIAQANGLIPRNPDDEGLSPVQWGFFVLEFLFVPVSWRYYVVERRAQKLRVARGLPKTLS